MRAVRVSPSHTETAGLHRAIVGNPCRGNVPRVRPRSSMTATRRSRDKSIAVTSAALNSSSIKPCNSSPSPRARATRPNAARPAVIRHDPAATALAALSFLQETHRRRRGRASRQLRAVVRVSPLFARLVRFRTDTTLAPLRHACNPAREPISAYGLRSVARGRTSGRGATVICWVTSSTTSSRRQVAQRYTRRGLGASLSY